MSILTDTEIRRLCLIPTHEYRNGYDRMMLAKVSDKYYYCANGESVPANVMEMLSPDICELELAGDQPKMITPFEPVQVRISKWGHKIISYGTSSMGYDVRLGNTFKIFTNVFNALIDPLDMPENCYADREGDYVIIPPNSYVLGHTIEHFHIPRDIMAVCVGKSTYARAGVSINVTPIEAGFVGNVVVEISNQTNLPVKVYSGMGIAQFMFFRSKTECEVSYADRDGKYQNQTGIQTALV